MTQSDEKYSHLLQPIRDLAANWNVNIANELEDYLEVLESVHFAFAEGGPSLNFAEAALLIQGSACIYSKKVEYLHTLVYQALEFIAERRKKDTRGQKDGGEDDGAEQLDDEFDDEEQFLSLDDILEEGTGIDLDEQTAVQMPVALRPPATLLALEDTGHSLGDGDAGNYRIASCAVHCSGALLLESRDGQHLDDDLQPMSSQVGAQAQYWAPSAAQQQQQQPGSGSAEDQQRQDDDGGGEAAGGFSGDDDYGGDFGGGEYSPADPDSNDALLGTAGLAAHHRQGGEAQPQQGEAFDPYKPLDPNSHGTLKAKPFKKAAKVPCKLKARQQQQHVAQVLDTLLTVHAPVTGLLLPEFAYALKQQEAAKSSQQRQPGGGSRTTSQRSTQTAAAFTYEEAVAGFAGVEEGHEDDANDGEDFYDGGGMGFDDDDEDGYAPLGEFAMPDMAAPATATAMGTDWVGTTGGDSFGAGPDELTYEELCRGHIEAFISAAAAAEVQSELAARVSGWRGKMAPALEEEDARPEFDIHAYGDRILNRMAQLTCGSGKVSAEVMRRGELEPVTFGQVVGAGPKYEASRTFSSMLQLINNGNVRITKLGGEQEQFALTLLDRVLPHMKVTEYRALGGAAAQQDAMKAAAVAEMHREEELAENQGARRPAPKAGKAGGKAKRHKG